MCDAHVHLVNYLINAFLRILVYVSPSLAHPSQDLLASQLQNPFRHPLFFGKFLSLAPLAPSSIPCSRYADLSKSTMDSIVPRGPASCRRRSAVARSARAPRMAVPSSTRACISPERCFLTVVFLLINQMSSATCRLRLPQIPSSRSPARSKWWPGSRTCVSRSRSCAV